MIQASSMKQNNSAALGFVPVESYTNPLHLEIVRERIEITVI